MSSLKVDPVDISTVFVIVYKKKVGGFVSNAK